jgi:hypothetical protein
MPRLRGGNKNIDEFVEFLKDVWSRIAHFPWFQILWILLAIFLIYHIVIAIMTLLTSGCKKHGPALMIEHFSDYDSSLAYFNGWAARNQAISTRIDNANTMVGAIRSNFSGLQSDICLVTNQIDDGLKGNYASNIPEDEYSLPAAEQKKRQDDRKAKSETYIPKLKQSFSEANDGAQLIECFEDMTDEQYAYLSSKRDELSSAVDTTESNFKALVGDFNNLRGEVSDKQIAIYYNTLAYNDKYIKMLVQQMSKSQESFVDFDHSKVDVIGSKEGFANSAEGEVLDFRVAKSGVMGGSGGKKGGGGRDPTTEPAHRIEVMEAQLVDVEKTLEDLGKAVQVFVNTTKMQSNKLKKTKAITTDTNMQKSKLNAQAGKVTAK